MSAPRRIDGARRSCLVLGSALAFGLPSARAQRRAPSPLNGDDPFGSMAWPGLRRSLAGEQPVAFHGGIVVSAPAVAEDASQVAVMITADAIESAQRIWLLADRNPMPLVADLRLGPGLLPRLGLRIRLEESTAVRALVHTRDGQWYAGGAWVDTAGGGCSQATSRPPSRDGPRMQGRVFEAPGLEAPPGATRVAAARLKLRVEHPMDSGWIPGQAEHRVRFLELQGTPGQVLARMELFPSVSSDPLISLDLASARRKLAIAAIDNHGHRILAQTH